LKAPLCWRNLGAVIKRSYRQKELASGILEIEMYGTELQVENRSDEWKHFQIRRRELDPACIAEIRVGFTQVVWDFADNQLRFGIELEPGENTTIAVKFHQATADGTAPKSIRARAKIGLRRRLCEVRDNYITPARSKISALAR
jgi:hypothetical protein